MIIGLITINDFSFHPNLRLQQSALKSGHQVILINPYKILASLKNNTLDISFDNCIQKPDIILPRQGSPMGEYGLSIIRQLEQMGIPLVNGLEGVTIARSQYITLQTLASYGIPVPKSCFITDASQFSNAVDFLGGYPVIVKQVDGMGGDGVIKVNQLEAAVPFLNKHLKALKGIVVQEYIPLKDRKDIRLFVIGDTVVSAVELEPLNNEFRTNIHQNGTAKKIQPPAKWKRLAVDSAKACCLEIAGVDMIIGKNKAPEIIEVNYSPGFKGLEAATGLDIAQKIVQYAEFVFNKRISSRKTL